MRAIGVVMSGAVLLGAACGGPSRSGGAAAQQAGAPVAQGAASNVAGVQWAVPEGWSVQPPRSMRVATYAVPAAAGAEAGECAVYYFGPDQGGGVDANVDRWVGQFEGEAAAKRATREVGGLRVTTVEIAGTYLAPGGPMMQSQGRKPDSLLLGAIVEGPQGPVFFKAVGPRTTLEAARSAFDAMVASLAQR